MIQFVRCRRLSRSYDLLRHALPMSSRADDGQWDLVAARLRRSEAASARSRGAIPDRALRVSRRLAMSAAHSATRDESQHAKVIADLGRLKRELCGLPVAD